MSPKKLDLHGKKFGDLSVVREAERGARGLRWECLCVCGKSTTVETGWLTSGNTKSCGCRLANMRKTMARTHGGSYSKEYTVWAGMIQRCTNPKHAAYAWYGARGISVCDRWSSFESFIADMGPRPSSDHTLERVDNDKGYMVGNVKWVTKLEQGGNKRNNHLVTANGKTQHINEWARELGIDRAVIKDRCRRGWSDEEAILIPVGVRRLHWKKLC